MAKEHTKDIRVELKDVLAYKWEKYGRIYVRGYVLIDGAMQSAQSISNLFNQETDKQKLVRLIGRFEGFFNIIYLCESGVVAISDRVRSMPLFYGNNENGFFITDNPSVFAISSGIDQDELAIFRHALFTSGDRTLFTGVYAIGAGKYLYYTDGVVEIQPYMTYKYGKGRLTKIDEVGTLLMNSYLNMIDRVISVLGDRTAVIPLSGGHDSRLILYLLKSRNYKKVIAYSYGAKGHSEGDISRKVAEYFGVRYIYVSYKEALLRKLYDAHYGDFSKFASMGTSVPCLQEWYAVYHLKHNEMIPSNSCFIPGYSGDFLAGTHLSNDAIAKAEWKYDELLYHIFVRYYNEKDDRYSKKDIEILHAIEKNVCELIKKKATYSRDELNEIVERFDWYNRQSKYIVNAVRVYDYWGYQWLIPFFDKEQFEVWNGIDNCLRYQRKGFFRMEKEFYPDSLNNIGFYSPHKKSVLSSLHKVIIYGVSSENYMYGYYGISKLDAIKMTTIKQLRGVDIYSKDGLLDNL